MSISQKPGEIIYENVAGSPLDQLQLDESRVHSIKSPLIERSDLPEKPKFCSTALPTCTKCFLIFFSFSTVRCERSSNLANWSETPCRSLHGFLNEREEREKEDREMERKFRSFRRSSREKNFRWK